MLSEEIILPTSAFLLGIFFFLSGISKAKSLTGVSKGFSQKMPLLGVNVCYFVIVGVVALEILAPIFMVHATLGGDRLFGYYSAIGLAIFTFLANLIYHYPPKKENYNPFMRNMAIIGGLLLLSLEFQ